jgi:hypothetical protein
MKKIILFTAIIFAFVSVQCACAELIRGSIITNLDKKLKIVYGDMAIISLGRIHGVIKGDIMKIVKSSDVYLTDPIGKCAVQKTFQSTSICEIISMNQEIENKNTVYMEGLQLRDPKLFNDMIRLLDSIVEPYKPYDNIKVYVHDIYDEKNNTTAFSEKLKEDLVNVFRQKRRMTATKNIYKNYINYQNHYFDWNINRFNEDAVNKLKNSMKTFNIDVVLTGVYKINGDVLNIMLLIIDRNWRDKTIGLTLSAKDYSAAIAEVVAPYKPFKEKDLVEYSMMLSHKDYFPNRDEQREIISQQSEKELNFRYKFQSNKSKFNRISPGAVNVKVNKEQIGDIQKGFLYEKEFEKGRKRLLVSFVPILFENEDEIFELKKEINKEIILDLKDENNVNIEMTLDATYGKEKIDIKVFRKTVKEPIIMKSVPSITEKGSTIELYKD